MKGDLTLKVLEFISHFAEDTLEQIEATLSAGYGASSRGIGYELSKIHSRKARQEAERECKKIQEQHMQDFICRLKRSELIEDAPAGAKRPWYLTDKGKRKVFELAKRSERMGALPSSHYPKISSSQIIIVTFDIPEIIREKRNWFRAVLKNLGLKMVHKSVWMGRVKIPKELPEDLKKLGLIDFIEVFAISKTGTLKHLV